MLIKISTVPFTDHRGFFYETYNKGRFTQLGIDCEFVQDNYSFSRAVGTIRGLHFQSPPHAQAKLIRCVKGAIFDVAVDIRVGSPTYGVWEGCELTSENALQLYVPIGFAHGFVTLESNTEVAYKCSAFYEPKAEGSLLWDSCGIDWPLTFTPVLNQKDSEAVAFSDLKSPFIFGKNS